MTKQRLKGSLKFCPTPCRLLSRLRSAHTSAADRQSIQPFRNSPNGTSLQPTGSCRIPPQGVCESPLHVLCWYQYSLSACVLHLQDSTWYSWMSFVVKDTKSLVYFLSSFFTLKELLLPNAHLDAIKV